MNTILTKWKLTVEELTEIVNENPSLRGFISGYIGEYKAKKIFLSDARITNLKKYDDHDRSRKSDIAFTYKGIEIAVEVKSLQSSTVKKDGRGYKGKFQCDASDKRPVRLPNGSVVSTTCLLVGEFDLLAVNLFAFEEEWRFVFARNADLPRSVSSKYTPYQRKHLLATSMEVTWPPKPPFFTDPFKLLDKIVKEKRSG